MKELSIEQKATAYEDLLKKAKQYYDTENDVIVLHFLEELFPELCESEDEKVREDIISLVNEFWERIGSINPEYSSRSRMLAWLEKQGTSYTKKDVDDAYVEGMAFAKYELEKQGKQKLPIEKLPEEMKTIVESLGFTTQEECDEYNQMVSGLIMSDDNKEEQKQNVDNKKLTDVNHEYFSELLKNDKSDNIADYAYQCVYCMSHDWAIENPTWDNVQSACRLGAKWQKKHDVSEDWSEEDEKMIGRVRGIIEAYAFSQSAVDVNGDLCEKKFIDVDIWLKSLKERYTWKPSDEQMKQLGWVAEQNKDNMIGKELMSLYQDLKKLKT